MRLIDADALKQRLGMADDCPACSHYKRSCRGCSNELVTDDFCGAIDDAPTIEPERKTGRWVDCATSEHYKCSLCGFRAPYSSPYCEWLSDYCPNCGAYMKGETDD